MGTQQKRRERASVRFMVSTSKTARSRRAGLGIGAQQPGRDAADQRHQIYPRTTVSHGPRLVCVQPKDNHRGQTCLFILAIMGSDEEQDGYEVGTCIFSP